MPNQQHWGISLVTPPAAEPVSVAQAKHHLRVTFSNDDALIAARVSAARMLVEAWSRQVLMPTQYLLVLDRFPLVPNSQFSPGNPSVLTPVLQNTWPLDPSIWAISLPKNPVISIDNFQYTDITLGLTTLDPSLYTLDNVSRPARISNIIGSFWPSVAFVPNAVQITFTAGRAAASAVPENLKLAILMLTSLFYDNPSWQGNRELSDVPPAIEALIGMDSIEALW